MLRHGKKEAVKLEKVPVDQRPAILRQYLAVAPGARPHIPVDRNAPLSDFVPMAPGIPVFLIKTDPSRGIRPPERRDQP